MSKIEIGFGSFSIALPPVCWSRSSWLLRPAPLPHRVRHTLNRLVGQLAPALPIIFNVRLLLFGALLVLITDKILSKLICRSLCKDKKAHRLELNTFQRTDYFQGGGRGSWGGMLLSREDSTETTCSSEKPMKRFYSTGSKMKGEIARHQKTIKRSSDCDMELLSRVSFVMDLEIVQENESLRSKC